MNRVFSVILVVVLSGCAAKPKPIYLQNGKQGYVFTCSAAHGQCEAAAGETCKERGYTIVDDSQTTNSRSFVGIFGGGSNTTTMRKILIHCN